MKQPTLDWNALIFGSYPPSQIQWAVNDREWQTFRETLKGLPVSEKYEKLSYYLFAKEYSPRSQIQVTNYVNALKRGGLIK